MATYFQTRQPEFPTGQSPKEVLFNSFRNILDFASKGFTFAILILSRLKHPAIKAQKLVFSAITQAFGYIGAFFELIELTLIKNINLKKIADLLVSMSTFVLARVSSVPTYAGSLISSIWSFLQPLFFYAAMLFYDDPTKQEKLFYNGMKGTLAMVLGGVLTCAVTLIGIYLSPLAAIVISGVLLLPVVKTFVQSIVIPVVKLIVKEAVVPLIKSIMGEKLYAMAGAGLSFVRKGVASFFKNLFSDNKQEEDSVTIKVKQGLMKTKNDSLLTLGKSITKAQSYKMLDHNKLEQAINQFDSSVSVPKKIENQSFDYFRYIVKDKRPLSALLQDIVAHRKLLEAEIASSSFLSDRLQQGKRMDKVHVLNMLESFLLQWKQFELTPSVPDEKKAFIVGKKNNALVAIPFSDLGKERDKIVQKFNDYLRDKYPSAMQSVLFRGKVETLISEAYAWIKRPVFADIYGKIEAYAKKQPEADVKLKSINFLFSLLRAADDILHSGSTCTIGSLVLTPAELLDPANKAALQSKIVNYMVTEYPDFASSIDSRGERYGLFQAVMRRIYLYESNTASLEIKSTVAPKRCARSPC